LAAAIPVCPSAQSKDHSQSKLEDVLMLAYDVVGKSFPCSLPKQHARDAVASNGRNAPRGMAEPTSGRKFYRNFRNPHGFDPFFMVSHAVPPPKPFPPLALSSAP
jgi:hypothetical protein